MTQAKNLPTASCPVAIACVIGEVLVVDDDRHFCELARNMLALAGVRVAEVRGIGEGLAYLKHHEAEVAAILMDLVLPDGDGLQAIREFKARWPTTKVVAMSGMDAQELYRLTSAHPGADAVLSKSRVECLPALLLEMLGI
jgi:two-component system, cell cycle sensor histidine kinase and response regulator CckA